MKLEKDLMINEEKGPLRTSECGKNRYAWVVIQPTVRKLNWDLERSGFLAAGNSPSSDDGVVLLGRYAENVPLRSE